MAAEIHVEDVGTALRVLVLDEAKKPVDVSAAVRLEYTLVSPARRRFVRTAVLFTDGRDGMIQYVTQAGDLDVPGTWKLQVRVEVGTWSGSSNVVVFPVVGNI
jgi:hypothetical protein